MNDYETCPRCGGYGEIEWTSPNDVDYEDPIEIRICPSCNGTGCRNFHRETIMIPEDSINVNDLNLFELIRELCNNTETVNAPYCQMQKIDRDVTIEEVKEELDIPGMDINSPSRPLCLIGLPHIPDYIRGRSIKCGLQRDTNGEVYLTNTNSYDRDSSRFNAQRIVNQLRKQEQPDVW